MAGYPQTASNNYGTLPNAQYLYGLTPGYFPANGVAGIPQITQQGWSQGMGAFGGQRPIDEQFSGLASGMAGSLGGLSESGGFNRGAYDAVTGALGDMDFFDNPYLDEAIGAAQQGTTDAFNRTVMPQMNRGLSMAGPGAYSSDRAGIAEGLAQSDLQKTLANTEAGMRGDAYNTGMGAYLQNQGQVLNAAQQGTSNMIGAAGALGGLHDTAVAPYDTQRGLADYMTSIGQQQQNQMQNQLDAGRGRWDYQSNLPWQQFGQYNSAIGPYAQMGMGSQGSSNVSGGYAPTGGGGWGSLLSGAGNMLGAYNQAQQTPVANTGF